MKAYKYKRFVQGFHWSQSIDETLVYIPDFNIIIYKHGNKFGINNKEAFVNEAKEYLSDIQSGKIPKEYSSTGTFVKEIPEITEKHVTHSAVTLRNFEEIDLAITGAGVVDLIAENHSFEKEKEAFEKTAEKFYGNLKNLILEK